LLLRLEKCVGKMTDELKLFLQNAIDQCRAENVGYIAFAFDIGQGEIITFLSGYADGESLAGILVDLADKVRRKGLNITYSERPS